jgi:hypothetical protein
MNETTSTGTKHEPVGKPDVSGACCSAVEQQICCGPSEKESCCAVVKEREAGVKPSSGCCR